MLRTALSLSDSLANTPPSARIPCALMQAPTRKQDKIPSQPKQTPTKYNAMQLTCFGMAQTLCVQQNEYRTQRKRNNIYSLPLVRSVQVNKDVDGSDKDFSENQNNDNPLEQFALLAVSRSISAFIGR